MLARQSCLCICYIRRKNHALLSLPISPFPFFILTSNAPLFVRVGVHHIRNDTQQLIPVERVHVHPSFHTGAKGIKNDIGIVELENPITMNGALCCYSFRSCLRA